MPAGAPRSRCSQAHGKYCVQAQPIPGPPGAEQTHMPVVCYYHCATFVLGAVAGLCLALFSALPFLLGTTVGFCVYELNPSCVKSWRGWALEHAHLALGALKKLRPCDFAVKKEGAGSHQADLHSDASAPATPEAGAEAANN